MHSEWTQIIRRYFTYFVARVMVADYMIKLIMLLTSDFPNGGYLDYPRKGAKSTWMLEILYFVPVHEPVEIYSTKDIHYVQ